MDADRLSEVLDATYACLVRHGVRRTTMDDIASAMGVSRSAVYQYVRNKDDAFRKLAERLHTQALQRARQAAAEDAPDAHRIRGVLAAKHDLALQLIGDSPHTAELMDAKARLFAETCSTFTTELRTLLTDLFTQAGTTDPTRATEAADICLALVIGLETAPDSRRLLPRATDALITGLLQQTAPHPPPEPDDKNPGPSGALTARA
ncbi:TetR/AcrR family transcriptional regulator [Streptomyces pacificus]|uniref:TetR/AcrR family transcriptional regulator n=1 Tax=Streptomyces pacificus TaxID=2705029 RepID=A0A6A0ANB8_9ACTN|nr:TetR/AcrR family transcriptional regulator [Streptomyces pacificus]GFH34446.1 TetR/AcrR family transcriptional regulator [Streptomyces pacificus]